MFRAFRPPNPEGRRCLQLTFSRLAPIAIGLDYIFISHVGVLGDVVQFHAAQINQGKIRIQPPGVIGVCLVGAAGQAASAVFRKIKRKYTGCAFGDNRLGQG